MHEQHLSQTESRRLAAYLRDRYTTNLKDALSFWRMSPNQIETKLSEKFGLTVTAEEVCEAIGRN